MQQVHRLIRCAFVMIVLLGASSAFALPVLQVDAGGHLLGATGVQIGSQRYDVTFVDGTCAAVFGACDAAHFDFTSLSDADAAAQALLDQVFVDGPAGNFDSLPELTFGCSVHASCNGLIPYAIVDAQFPILIAGAFNCGSPSFDNNCNGFGDHVAHPQGSETLDLTTVPVAVWARFTPSELPEPGTLVLLALGLALIPVRRHSHITRTAAAAALLACFAFNARADFVYTYHKPASQNLDDAVDFSFAEASLLTATT